MLTMMGKGTIKITLPNNVNIIKFNAETDYNKLYSEKGYVEIDIIGRCNANHWNGEVYPQIFLDDYQIISSCAYIF